MLRKHPQIETDEIPKNSHDFPKNSHDFPKNSHDFPKNSHDSSKNSHDSSKNSSNLINEIIDTNNDNINQKLECQQCQQVFSSQWYYTKHIEKCLGIINKYECKHCGKQFKHERSRFGHYKICKSKALIVVPEGSDISSVVNIGTQNNIQTQNNTQNNINIIIYNQEKTKFTQEHITPEFINQIIREHRKDSKVIQEYSKRVLAHPENQCIKKEDLKSAHSKVHVGNNEWIIKRDSDIYPNLVCTLSNELSETLNRYKDTLKIIKSKYQELLRETDCMADEGYINTEDIELQREKKNSYLQMIQFLKVAIHNQTKLCKRMNKLIS